MTNAYLDLARRCEEASGPDRELDADIASAMFPPVWGEKQPNGAQYNRDYLKWERLSLSCPTKYLDAAMSLVPEGALFDVGHFGDEKPGIFIASILPSRSPTQASEAATPALALCAASLRARGSDNG